jgi:hypothetical protein
MRRFVSCELKVVRKAKGSFKGIEIFQVLFQNPNNIPHSLQLNLNVDFNFRVHPI